jgi:hypothetical protein
MKLAVTRHRMEEQHRALRLMLLIILYYGYLEG